MKIDLSNYTYEELKDLSMKKNSLGCATEEALQAQFVLYDKAGRGFSRNHNPFSYHRDGEYICSGR